MVDGDAVATLDHAWPTLRAALDAGLPAIAAAAREPRQGPALRDVRLLPPVPDPEKIVCTGANYRSHFAETGRQPKRFPALFMRFPNAQVGAFDPIVRPFLDDTFDWEAELAVVIGAPARHVPPERAREYVAGYACFGDHTLRRSADEQQIVPGKNFYHSGVFGPWIVTADEIPDPARLELWGRLNGQVMQHTSVADLVYDIPFLISYISSFTELRPGDVISTGTPAGTGSARKPPVWMKPGDVFEIEISQIGICRNVVVDEERTAGRDAMNNRRTTATP